MGRRPIGTGTTPAQLMMQRSQRYRSRRAEEREMLRHALGVALLALAPGQTRKARNVAWRHVYAALTATPPSTAPAALAPGPPNPPPPPQAPERP